KMNALAVISNCPQVNNPCNGGNPTAIRIVISS
ncbi:MAG TPA: urea carboxylase, partial [Gammaproteobacteria bacterium]|nr:urea carboxylase [Gammaproteobacteria bacterium]